PVSLWLARSCDGSFGGGGYQCGVFGENPACIAGRRSFPQGQSALDLGFRDIDIQPAFGNIKDDRVAIANGGDGTAMGSFRGNMTGHEAMRRPAESPISHERDGFSQPLTN